MSVFDKNALDPSGFVTDHGDPLKVNTTAFPTPAHRRFSNHSIDTATNHQRDNIAIWMLPTPLAISSTVLTAPTKPTILTPLTPLTTTTRPLHPTLPFHPKPIIKIHTTTLQLPPKTTFDQWLTKDDKWIPLKISWLCKLLLTDSLQARSGPSVC